MKLGSSRGMDTKRPRGSERSKPCHQLQLTRRSQPPYPWPPEQAQPGVSKPYRTTLHALGFGGSLVLAGVKGRICGHKIGCAPKPRLMRLDRRDEKVGVVGAAVIDFIVDNDLVLGLLQLDHLAELVGLGRLALANDLRRRLEQAEKLPFDMRVAAKEARPCLFHHLPHPRRHLLDLLTQ